MNCPNEHGKMPIRTKIETVTFRNKKIQYNAMHYQCPKCGINVDDIELATENQRKLSDAYRKAVNLLTADEIVEGRKKNYSGAKNSLQQP